MATLSNVACSCDDAQLAAVATGAVAREPVRDPHLGRSGEPKSRTGPRRNGHQPCTRLPSCVDSLAAEYGRSRTHFSHFFRTRTGLTPARFAAEVRAREATRMPLDNRAPLKQIAEACGFASVNYFCQVFRRFQHMSPMSYRRAVR